MSREINLFTSVLPGPKELREMISGFRPGELIIVNGRPGAGKTTFALHLVRHAASELKKPAAFFSLDKSREQLAAAVLGAEAAVDVSRILEERPSSEDWPRLTSAAGRLRMAPIFIDTSSVSVEEIANKTRRLKEGHEELGLVVVDYIQLLRSGGCFERRELEESEIMRSLESLAKELSVPFLLLSQLRRLVPDGVLHKLA